MHNAIIHVIDMIFLSFHTKISHFTFIINPYYNLIEYLKKGERDE